MSPFIRRRLLLAIPTLFGVLGIAFLLLYVAPGDPVMAMAGERADEQTIPRLRAARCLAHSLPAPSAHPPPLPVRPFGRRRRDGRPRPLLHHHPPDPARHPRALPQDAAARRCGDAL